MSERVPAAPTGSSQVVAAQLYVAVVDVDLQLYKASIAKLRWGSPGGNDAALEYYAEAVDILRTMPWSGDLAPLAADLAGQIERFSEILRAMDVTRASLQQTRMLRAFKQLKRAARVAG